ncbi:MAG TPA: universal stress protein [Pseudonocardiaceae bacterium]|jgi:nucleotide-binding universal stress UspA family protein|nr:universal stress protein [Pseudonocardiaceae bacterium]
MASIVVGIDGSQSAQDALRFAVHEATIRGVGLRVVTAWHIPMITYGGAGLVPDIDPTGFVKNASAVVETALAALGEQANDVEIERVVRMGQPAQVFVEQARDAALLVVGSRGHGGFAGLLLGSVSHQCALHASCPVVIVRQPHSTA